VSKNFVDWLIPSKKKMSQKWKGLNIEPNTHPKTNMEPKKWIVEKLTFLFGSLPIFRGCFLNFRVGYIRKNQRMELTEVSSVGFLLVSTIGGQSLRFFQLELGDPKPETVSKVGIRH